MPTTHGACETITKRRKSVCKVILRNTHACIPLSQGELCSLVKEGDLMSADPAFGQPLVTDVRHPPAVYDTRAHGMILNDCLAPTTNGLVGVPGNLSRVGKQTTSLVFGNLDKSRLTIEGAAALQPRTRGEETRGSWGEPPYRPVSSYAPADLVRRRSAPYPTSCASCEHPGWMFTT